jgi:hypothetical protein
MWSQDNIKLIANYIINEAQRRTGRSDGMIDLRILKQVQGEVVDIMEDHAVDVPAAFTDDPEQQQALHALLRQTFAEIRADIDKALP